MASYILTDGDLEKLLLAKYTSRSIDKHNNEDDYPRGYNDGIDGTIERIRENFKVTKS